MGGCLGGPAAGGTAAAPPKRTPKWLCTRWTVNGTHYYYNAQDLRFETNSDATCALAVAQEVGSGNGAEAVPQVFAAA